MKKATSLTSSAMEEDQATERARAAEYLSHMAAIVEFSDDAIISKSLEGIVRTWNKGAERMFGFTAEEAVGKHISMIIPSEYIQEEKAILKQICSNKII